MYTKNIDKKVQWTKADDLNGQFVYHINYDDDIWLCVIREDKEYKPCLYNTISESFDFLCGVATNQAIALKWCNRWLASQGFITCTTYPNNF